MNPNVFSLPCMANATTSIKGHLPARVRQSTWAGWAFCLFLLCISTLVQAQTLPDAYALETNRKITTTARMLGVSHAQVLDTYLSPEHYTGCDLRYISQTQREREGQRLSQLITQTGNVAYLKNRAESGNEIAGMYSFSYALHYGFHWFDRRLQLQVGGRVETNVGFIYNTHNSNNPAQARVFLHLAPSAVASYKAQVGNVPLLRPTTVNRITRYSPKATTITTSFPPPLSLRHHCDRCSP